MNAYRVYVTATYAIDTVAEDRDAAAMAALAELNRGPDDLTHSGVIAKRDESVSLVLREQGGHTWVAG